MNQKQVSWLPTKLMPFLKKNIHTLMLAQYELCKLHIIMGEFWDTYLLQKGRGTNLTAEVMNPGSGETWAGNLKSHTHATIHHTIHLKLQHHNLGRAPSLRLLPSFNLYHMLLCKFSLHFNCGIQKGYSLLHFQKSWGTEESILKKRKAILVQQQLGYSDFGPLHGSRSKQQN